MQQSGAFPSFFPPGRFGAPPYPGGPPPPGQFGMPQQSPFFGLAPFSYPGALQHHLQPPPGMPGAPPPGMAAAAAAHVAT
eukprot:1029928-Prorocentrum_minimum.AAC.1